jgi:uncharacterized protein YaaN involved in tellurite resistance
MTESTVPSINMGALLGTPESNPEPTSALERALAKVEPDDAAATSMEQVKFQFRNLLDERQRTELTTNAPAVAAKMIGDYNAIIQFGGPVLDKLNAGSVELLNAQRQIKVPEAEIIVNDLLREIDGYSAKFRSEKAEGVMEKVSAFFKGTTYSLKAMVRESKPIADKLDIAEVSLRKMELSLADNVTRGQQLHKNINETMVSVVAVLAALEEIVEVAKADFFVIDEALKDVDAQEAKDAPVVTVEFKGKTISSNELRNQHTIYANGISELEKTWFDWRQQFFLGYSQSPSVLNLILVSATMQRRCQVFRTMGIPSGRTALAMLQQAVLVKDGAAMGTAVQEGTNKLIQHAFKATGEAVTEAAMAAQTPIVSEETVFAIVDSIKVQCEGLVAADKWGRDMRNRNIQALENGEAGIKHTFTESRRALVANAVQATRQPQALAPAPESEILTQLGVIEK